jgi:hypothetical protein
VYSQDCGIWSAGKKHPNLKAATTSATPTQHISLCILKMKTVKLSQWCKMGTDYKTVLTI